MAHNFHQILHRVEMHLQALVEGGSARLFPAYTLRNDLVKRLVEAMQVEIRSDPDGTLVAPNQFTIFMPEEQALEIQNQPELLEELSDCLSQACQDTQVRFASDPVLKVIPNSEPGTLEIQIVAQFSSPLDEATSVMEPMPASNTIEQTVRAFLIVDGMQIFPLTGKLVRIGQSQENELVVDHPQVCPVHAQLRLVNGQYMIFDLSSVSGTFVNGVKVSQCFLSPGDVISLGGLPLVFGMDHSANLDPTQELPIFS